MLQTTVKPTLLPEVDLQKELAETHAEYSSCLALEELQHAGRIMLANSYLQTTLGIDNLGPCRAADMWVPSLQHAQQPFKLTKQS